MVNAVVKYKGVRKRHSWCKWYTARTLRQNKNNLISIIGGTGSGKTYSAISIGEICSEMSGIPFTIDHIVFSLKELMNLINSDKVKKGSVIIFDEPQVSISAREFQSEANKVFNYLLSTFRHRNLSLIFCTPFESLLDKNTRKLFHCRIITDSINRNTNMCNLIPRFLDHVDYKPEPYAKCLIEMWDNNGKRVATKLQHWEVPKPSQELIDLYEQKKLDFTNNLNKNILSRLEKFEEGGKSLTADHNKDTRKSLTHRQKEVMILLANCNVSNRYEFVADKLGIAPSNVNRHRNYAEKKGYSIEEFKGVVLQ